MANSFQITIGNAILYGEHQGSGEPLVFLHAGVADLRMWRPQIEAFSNNYHTVTYDRRGFGKTTSPDEPFSHGQDLAAILAHFDIDKVTLVGSSQGGRIAIDFALDFPNRVNKLILIAPAVSGAPAPDSYPAEILALFDRLDVADEADDLQLINEIEAEMWLDGPMAQAGRVSGPIRDLFLDMNGIALEMPDLKQEIEPASAYERVNQITAPTLVLWGDYDVPHLQTRCRYLVGAIEGAQGREILGTAHLPNLEQTELTNNTVQEFLEG